MATLNVENRTLFHGDNLEFLRGINSEAIDLIATDPPFNKNKDFHATPDSLAAGARFSDRWSWQRDVHQDWIDQIADDWPQIKELIEGAWHTHSEGMAAFIAWLSVRTMEMHRVLKPTGSLYLHCDQTASHYIKMMLDGVFGPKQFRNAIVWQRAVTKKGMATKILPNDVDYIFHYARDKTPTWNVDAVTVPYDMDNLPEKTKKQYNQRDAAGRLWRLSEITAPQQDPSSNLTYEVMGVTRTWRWKPERMRQAIADGLVVQTSPGNVPRQIRYLDEQKGHMLNNIWTDVPNLVATSKERTGYPTQKPLALYSRIIKASSNEGDVVLDPFAGCATTLVAAEHLNRKWIGMDIWDGAADVVTARMQRDLPLESPYIRKRTDIPERTDDQGVAAPFMKRILRAATEPWQKLSHAAIRQKLIAAQRIPSGDVVCAGCGRALEDAFMELDHIRPRADGGANDITNRILLCSPCNRKKGGDLTLRGLVRANKKDGWTEDAALAKAALQEATHAADRVQRGD